VRYERGAGPGTIPAKDLSVLPIGKADLTRSGHDVAILSFGGMLQTAHEVAEQLDASVANMRFIKPLDETLLTHIANSHRLLVTIENNAVAGGAGSAVNESLSRLGLDCQILNLGLPDSFVEHGTQGELLQAIKIDTPGILASIDKRLNS
jgi:1-deoxy-D-xylulose-5-phosphate synthase